jgi:hypothetical protein
VRRRPFVLLVLLAVTATVLPATLAAAAPPRPHTLTTSLSGAEEVPPVATKARGTAIVRWSGDGSELTYRLIVANIQDVTMAHIHLGAAGENGPVVAWLYPSAPPAQLVPGRSSGVLATGTITDADLVGPLTGMTMADLIEAIEAGDTYVNVHTSRNPAGEVRGQL